ncbi:MAG: hypothetical protein KGR26_04365, partial [Cyanobacteria bacterium REEB65]|nr:hypothetical protein [Cyanobacteria bacterium REEB65]
PVKDAQGNPLKDANGNPVLQSLTVFPDAPTAQLGLAMAQDVIPEVLRFTANLGIAYPFRRSAPEPVETWNGLDYDWGAGLAYWFLPDLGASLEVLGQWANPAEQDGTIVCTTGHDIWQLAPGLAYQPLPGVTVGLSVLLPLFATGYQWDYVYPLSSAVSLQLDL